MTPHYLKNDILNITYLPTIQGYQVSNMLTAQDPFELTQGILAAEFIGINGNEKFYVQPVGALTTHPDPGVAQLAASVHGQLLARQ